MLLCITNPYHKNVKYYIKQPRKKIEMIITLYSTTTATIQYTITSMTYIVAKKSNPMDTHKKIWKGHGKTRLSAVTFIDDPVPEVWNPRDYIMIPPPTYEVICKDDIWYLASR